jgi:DtxR family Mn-dependent transcriptional regulator
MDSPEARRRRGLSPLDEVRPGQPVIVASVFERDRGLLEHLDGLGIRPGAELKRADVPDDNIRLESAGREITVSRPAAAKVWVKHLSANS